MTSLSLFAWPELHDAEQAAARAHADWQRAKYRAWVAPRGHRQAREAEVKRTAHVALEAAALVRRLRAMGVDG